MAQYVAIRALNRSSNIRVVEAFNRWSLRVSATAGQFKLTVTGQTGGASDTTADLAYNISAADLETALAGLTTVPDLTATNLVVTGGPGDETGSTPYEIAVLLDQEFIFTPVAGTTPLSGGTGATVTELGNKVKLSTTVDTVVDLDRPTNQRALNRHGAIGQWTITASNDDIHNDALPANS